MTAMEDKFNQFFSKYNGQPNVGDTPENTGQCVGLIEVFTDSLNLPHTWGNANDLLKDADPNSFDIIDNTPDAQPQVGDIIVWDSKFNGTVGHTGIATGTNTTVNKFDCFEQNDPLGSYPHVRSYSYAYIDGWMRPKVVDSTQTLNMPQYFETLLQENSLNINDESQIRAFFQQAINFPSCYTDKLNAQTDLASANNKISDLTSANKQQADMIGGLQKELSSVQNAPKIATTPTNQPIYPNATTVQSGSFLGWLKRLLGI